MKRCKRSGLYTIIVASLLALAVAACDSTGAGGGSDDGDNGGSSDSEDTTAPSPGDNGTLSTSNKTSSSIDLTWDKASDNVTATSELQYSLRYSMSDNIGTVSDAETNGSEAKAWGTDISSVTVGGLTSGTQYYFNVLVRDGSGNKAAYTSTSAKTLQSQWTTVGVARFSDAASDFNHIVFGPNDTPYVAYRDRENNDAVTVQVFSGSSWQTLGATGDSAGEGPNSSSNMALAVTADGTPYVAFTDKKNSERGTVLEYSGSWQVLGGGPFSAEGAYDLSMAVDSNGTLYVAYTDYGTTNNKLTVRKYDGSWQTVGSAGFSGGGATASDISISSKDVPYVVYTDGDNGSEATVQKYDGGWNTVGAAGFTPNVANEPEIALDSVTVST